MTFVLLALNYNTVTFPKKPTIKNKRIIHYKKIKTMNLTTNIFKPKEKKSKVIFIIEDNPVFAKVLKTYLMAKFNDVEDVIIFPAGEVCLAELHRNPAAIIIDYFLGTTCDDAVTGLETIVQIKAQKSEANIIMLSAWREEEVPLETLKDFNYSYVEKNPEAFKRVEKLIRMSW
jgi:two-component system OmpR family response regulator